MSSLSSARLIRMSHKVHKLSHKKKQVILQYPTLQSTSNFIYQNADANLISTKMYRINGPLVVTHVWSSSQTANPTLGQQNFQFQPIQPGVPNPCQSQRKGNSTSQPCSIHQWVIQQRQDPSQPECCSVYQYVDFKP